MHELSIARSLVDIASDAAAEAQATQVDVVTLRIGALSGVVKEALLFSYDIVIENSILAESRLEIEELPVIVHCPTCQVETTLPNIQRFRCGQCDQPTADIVQGREMDVVSIEYS